MNTFRRSPALPALALTLASFLAVPPSVARAGTLDAFEADTAAPTQPSPRERGGRAEQHADRDDPEDDAALDSLGQLFLYAFGAGIAAGGMCSWERATGCEDADFDLEPREPGEPLLSVVRLDAGWQSVGSDVAATDLRFEAGFGPLGVHVNRTLYREEEPKDDLTLTRILGLWRMSLGSRVELDLGLGALTLDGEDNDSRLIFALPLLIQAGEHAGIEFRPSWAERVSDYDAAVLLTWGYASLKGGYRWTRTPHESLDGPYVGLSVRL